MGTRVEEVPRLPGAGERALRSGKRSIWPFLGPAFIACVAYMDPGNFATNIAGGSKFGFTLVWVIVASNLMAMLIQTLSAKLGIATGRNLPEVCRERFSRRTSIGLWILFAVLFLGGVQLMSIGVLGRYLAHVHDQVLARPLYLVTRVVGPSPAPGPGSAPTDRPESD